MRNKKPEWNWYIELHTIDTIDTIDSFAFVLPDQTKASRASNDNIARNGMEKF